MHFQLRNCIDVTSVNRVVSLPNVSRYSVIAAVVLGAVPHTTLAQGAPQGRTLEEIVVTAQRRAENLQDVPISIMAVSAEDMQRAGIVGTNSLGTLVAGFTSTTTSTYFQPRIRGIGTSLFGPALENPVALYIDDVYIGSQHAAPLDLSDMEQVAVLRGPQGTLFGRNTTGGVVQMTTRQPREEFSGELSTELDNYLRSRSFAYVTGAVSDTLKANLFVRYITQEDGWGENLVTGEDVFTIDHDVTVRTNWVWTPTDATTATLGMDYNDRQDSLGPHVRIVPGVGGSQGLLPGLGTTITSSDDHDVTETHTGPTNESEEWGANLKIEHDFGPTRLVSITSYRDLQFDTSFSIDGSTVKAFDVFNNQRSDQFTQELQLQSSADSDIQWVVGAYYYEASDRLPEFTLDFYNVNFASLNPTGCAGLTQFFFPMDPSCADVTGTGGFANQFRFQWIDQTLDSESYAFFGQATVAVTDNTRLTGGLRYTQDDRSIDGSRFSYCDFFTGTLGDCGFGPPTIASQSIDDDQWTWRAAIDHDFSDEVLGYAYYNRGYKSGGYNGFGSPDAAPFKSEIVDSYELGLKAELLDRRLRVNPALFYNDYENPQVSVVDAFVVIAANAGSAEVYGFDLDAQWQATEKLGVTLGFEWLHAEYTEFDNIPFAIPVPGGNGRGLLDAPTAFENGLSGEQNADGNRMNLAPEFTYNIALDYAATIGGQRVDFFVVNAFSDSYFTEPDNVAEQGSYNMMNASVTWTSSDDRLSAGIWGRNLLDELIAAGQFQSAAPMGYVANYGVAPRTYGFSLSYRFGGR